MNKNREEKYRLSVFAADIVLQALCAMMYIGCVIVLQAFG